MSTRRSELPTQPAGEDPVLAGRDGKAVPTGGRPGRDGEGVPTTGTAGRDGQGAPVQRARRGARGERTRRRLLDSAEEIFAAIGFHDASIVKITEAAGVAQGTFYLYFPSKQEIFDEVVADLNHRVRQAMAEASAGAPDRLEAERRGFAAFFRFTAEHPALYQVMRQAEFVSPRAFRQHYERIIEGYLPPLAAAMQAGEIAPVDPQVLAWALGAIGEAIGMRFIVWPGAGGIPTEVFEAMMTLVARMLGRDPRSDDGASRPPARPRPPVTRSRR